MPDTPPALSAILVAGPLRRRAGRVLQGLRRQTAASSVEIIVLDLAPAGTPRLESDASSGLLVYRELPGRGWAEARYEGVLLATAPVVAFIEDHCYPAPGWAEALIEAHRGPWAAVGYCFTNANPDSYFTRASMINDYGLWMYPAPAGPLRLMPGSNISYKRDLLVGFGERLKHMLTPDFGVCQAIQKRGLTMYLEPRALAAHENIPDLPNLIRAHVAYGRLLGARRAEIQCWNRLRRLAYAAVTPAVSPVITAWRLLASLRGRPSLWSEALRAAPVFLLGHLAGGCGEALGYALGAGDAERKMSRFELEMPRSTLE
jgi:hypothetical protein